MQVTNILFYGQRGVTGQLWTWGRNTGGVLGQNSAYASSKSSPATTADNGTSWCQISAGGNNNMGGIKTDASLWLWGVDQLACVPINISTPTIKWSCLAVGFSSKSAFSNEGVMFTWGSNTYGQLATNNTTSRSSPGQISEASWCYVVNKSFNNALAAIKTDGTLWTWGTNQDGMLGQNKITSTLCPNTVSGGGTNWTQVAVGYRHTLGLKSDGTVWSWGNNSYGQLGSGNLTFRSSPSTVIGSNTLWCQLSASNGISAAIKTDGTLYTWGINRCGRLGDGTTIYRSSPSTIFGNFNTWCFVTANSLQMAAIKCDGSMWTWGRGPFGDGVSWCSDYRSSPGTTAGNLCVWKKVLVGWYTSSSAIALKNDGTLWTWGSNAFGQLGNNCTVPRCSPGTVSGNFSDWCDITNGGLSMSAIKTNGSIYSWGNNASGQLGTGDKKDRSSPTSVLGGSQWKMVGSTLNSRIALKNNNTIWTWGNNVYGELGTGNTTARYSPGQVCEPRWCSISGNSRNFLALKTDGSLWAWGNNCFGALGDNSVINRSSPITTAGGGNSWCTISATHTAGSAIKTDSSLWVWGYGAQGSIGDNNIINRSSPVQTTGGTSWCQVSLSGQSTLAIKLDGTLWAWGDGATGQLGLNSTTDKSSPTQVAVGSADWSKVNIYGGTVIALKTDSTIWTWGQNFFGQLGSNSTIYRSSPNTTSGGGTGWCDVVTASAMMGAIKGNFLFYVNRQIFSWGDNTYGQLANNSTTDRSSPGVVVGGQPTWCDAAIGLRVGGGIKTDGTLWMWGQGARGSIGDNLTSNRCSPVTTSGGGTTWKSISILEQSVSAIKSDGTLWNWGSNYEGRLGDGTTTCRSSPVTVSGGGTTWCFTAASAAIKTDGTLWTWGINNFGRLGQNIADLYKCSPATVSGGGTNWCRVAVGSLHAVAIKTDGTLWTWGRNTTGQLGVNDTTNRSSPISTTGGGTSWANISIGNDHTIGRKNDGTLWLWGANAWGQLGLNNTAARSSPVQIAGTDWQAIGNGGQLDSTFAIKVNGSAWAWGRNYCSATCNGSLGDCSIINRSSPVSIKSSSNSWKMITGGSMSTLGILCTT